MFELLYTMFVLATGFIFGMLVDCAINACAKGIANEEVFRNTHRKAEEIAWNEFLKNLRG